MAEIEMLSRFDRAIGALEPDFEVAFASSGVKPVENPRKGCFKEETVLFVAPKTPVVHWKVLGERLRGVGFFETDKEGWSFRGCEMQDSQLRTGREKRIDIEIYPNFEKAARDWDERVMEEGYRMRFREPVVK
ncbi:MAG TPA: hypothetical protein VHE53_01830 [Patescibacteria group bacterium]|nr:hypothetical protein [Patescibacteria group bacterium]